LLRNQSNLFAGKPKSPMIPTTRNGPDLQPASAIES